MGALFFKLNIRITYRSETVNLSSKAMTWARVLTSIVYLWKLGKKIKKASVIFPSVNRRCRFLYHFFIFSAAKENAHLNRRTTIFLKKNQDKWLSSKLLNLCLNKSVYHFWAGTKPGISPFTGQYSGNKIVYICVFNSGSGLPNILLNQDSVNKRQRTVRRQSLQVGHCRTLVAWRHFPWGGSPWANRRRETCPRGCPQRTVRRESLQRGRQSPAEGLPTASSAGLGTPAREVAPPNSSLLRWMR